MTIDEIRDLKDSAELVYGNVVVLKDGVTAIELSDENMDILLFEMNRDFEERRLYDENN